MVYNWQSCPRFWSRLCQRLHLRFRLWLWLQLAAWFWLRADNTRRRRGLRLRAKGRCGDGVFEYVALLPSCCAHLRSFFVLRIHNSHFFAALQVGQDLEASDRVIEENVSFSQRAVSIGNVVSLGPCTAKEGQDY